MPERNRLRQEILSVLKNEARIDHERLAAMLGTTTEAVAQEMKALEDEQVILQYGTTINWQKVGNPKLYAMIDVKVTPQRGHGFDALARRLYRFSEVHSLYLMSGAYDLSLMLEVDSMEAVGRFVSEKLAPLDSVVSTTTHFVLKKYKENGVIFDDPENDQRLVISP
jgi:DNA-binding Lrp family transcriptional regulator